MAKAIYIVEAVYNGMRNDFSTIMGTSTNKERAVNLAKEISSNIITGMVWKSFPDEKNKTTIIYEHK